MMLIVWLVVAGAAVLLLAVLGYGLFGQFKRLRNAVADAQTEMAPHLGEITQGIRRAQTMRMFDGADTTHGHGRHA